MSGLDDPFVTSEAAVPSFLAQLFNEAGLLRSAHQALPSGLFSSPSPAMSTSSGMTQWPSPISRLLPCDP